jgi:hypothetical protein
VDSRVERIGHVVKHTEIKGRHIHPGLGVRGDQFIGGDLVSYYNIVTTLNYLPQLQSTQSRGNLDYYIT